MKELSWIHDKTVRLNTVREMSHREILRSIQQSIEETSEFASEWIAGWHDERRAREAIWVYFELFEQYSDRSIAILGFEASCLSTLSSLLERSDLLEKASEMKQEMALRHVALFTLYNAAVALRELVH